MRTACYARFSSDLQKDTSLEDQLRVCREYVDHHGWHWQDQQVYSDAAVTAASLEGRPGIQAVLAAATAPARPFDVLVVDDSSRVARDLPDALRVLQRLKFCGVRVIYISQGIDSANEQAETLVAVHGIVDGLFLRELAMKVRRGLAGQLERGFATGSSHYGYRAIPIPDPSGKRDARGRQAWLGVRLEIDEAEAAIILCIFEWYAAGLGVGTIVDRLRVAQTPGPRGGTWKVGAVRDVLKNERFTGRAIWGQTRYERVPGTRRRVARPVPRSQWRIQERPELRIVSDHLWATVQARREAMGQVARQAGSSLMRGSNAALHSKHLFSGFMRCGLCGSSFAVVSGSWGTSSYGCIRRSKNGRTACENRFTIRAPVADRALLDGLRKELTSPDLLAYISRRLADALNQVNDARPRQREELAASRLVLGQRLGNLLAAVEHGAGTSTVFQAIRDREAELRTIDAQLVQLEEPLEQRMAVIPGWVRAQLDDTAALLGEVSERAKLQFQRLGLQFTVTPIYEADRIFLRAEGHGAFEQLAFGRYVDLATRSTPDPLGP